MQRIATPVQIGVIEKLREEELEQARSIQSVMLPAEPLRAGGVRISHEFQPVAEVGGDFLDYFELTDRCIGLYLGDVSGKGLPAARYAAPAVGGDTAGTVRSFGLVRQFENQD
jgi:serine phosphatase RsbU (regulator of sigma subunit)